MKRVVLYPYHMRCSGPREIVKGLREKGINALRVYPGRAYRPRKDDIIINWGCSTIPKWNEFGLDLKNPWGLVNYAINKISTFLYLDKEKVNIPPFTTTPEDAKGWLQEGKVVFGRSKVAGRGGAGIIIMEKEEDFQPCLLYTKYIKKRKEFRVHVFDGVVIDFQEKKKKHGVSYSKIRNHANGWVFARKGAELPDDMSDQCIKAVAALGLNFGAVDAIWNETENKSYVLEVNTAPGIEGTTVSRYVDVIAALV